MRMSTRGPSVCIFLAGLLAQAPGGWAQSSPFTFLQTGYTQTLFGATTVANSFGGVGFAANGDVWVKPCNSLTGPVRFVLGQTKTVNSSTVHPPASLPAAATGSGCGMTNHPDGFLYLNTSSGVQRLDPNTGAAVATIGPQGNSYGIVVDPQTNHLVYPASGCNGSSSCRLITLDPSNGSSQTLGTFTSSVGAFEDVDGIAFDPTGNYIIVAGRTGVFPQDTPYLLLLTRTATLVQQLPAGHFPDGVGFHQNPPYIIANNNDGTISRLDFPSGDLRQTPVETVIASGGFRGDLTGVNADGCFYVTQAGTRYANNLTTAENSIVKVCSTTGQFLPPPGLGPSISFVGNAFGDAPLIAPNTWVEIKGVNLSPPGDSRIWLSGDFANNQLPLQLDGVSATVNGKAAYVYFVSSTQVNVLTPPDAMTGAVQVQLSNNGIVSNTATVQAAPQSLSFFEFVSSTGLHYVYGRHTSDSTLIGPTTLFSGLTTPVKPGESIFIAATGFGPTSVPIVPGALTQSGDLPAPFPVIMIGGIPATVNFAGLVGVGTYQINLVVPQNVPSGDNALTATYNGLSIQSNLLITVQP
jgi:uncharacterized protein (TIGR03437 family)